LYDCTLGDRDLEENKREQIINYCNRLQQGSIDLVGGTTEEFHNHHKQVWLVTRGNSRRMKLVNSIAVKEIAVQDLINLYQERLQAVVDDEQLESKLRNL
jgi:phosphopantetheine adenylyltransferase